MDKYEFCKDCGSLDFETRLNGQHVGLYCAVCGKFLKFKKQEHNIDTGKLASESQEGYARKLYEDFNRSGARMTASVSLQVIFFEPP